MKPLRLAVALVALTAGCTSTSPPTTYQAARTSSPDAGGYTSSGAPPNDAASRPPRLSVGTSYPDTQLILPWFLNYIIDFVNYR